MNYLDYKREPSLPIKDIPFGTPCISELTYDLRADGEQVKIEVWIPKDRQGQYVIASCIDTATGQIHDSVRVIGRFMVCPKIQ